MKIIDRPCLDSLFQQAALSDRLRKNYNLHDGYQDPIQRLLNAMEPGTYVRPHRHPDGIWELFILLSGQCSLLIFDDRGQVTDRIDMACGGTQIMEVPVRAWHCVVVTAPQTLILEVKPGPYCPVDAKDFADWAPTEQDTARLDCLQWLEQARPGSQFRPLA